MQQKLILVFDIGKTNKKYFLFDEALNQLESQYVQIPEIEDDDGDACDDLDSIVAWMLEVLRKIKDENGHEIAYINFSGYGATLVHLDKNGKVCTPMYNYLKPFPEKIKSLFSQKYGPLEDWSKQTASPFLGMLNAGLQLFWLKNDKPDLYKKIRHTVFLPQYLSCRLTGVLAAEFTCIGCHTGMWDFRKNDFHLWMIEEGFAELIPQVIHSNIDFPVPNTRIRAGIGIHDSSAALLPYLLKSAEPFILLSTGTWSICLNPFNEEPLTSSQLSEDCLSYLQPNGKQVKASRLFLGNIFSSREKLLAGFFNKPEDYHHTVEFDSSLFQKAKQTASPIFLNKHAGESSHSFVVSNIDLSRFDSYEEGYHHLVKELAEIQKEKIFLVLGSKPIYKIYVDGGFAKNRVFLGALEQFLPDCEFIPSDNPLGSSLGAAMTVNNKIMSLA